MGDPLSQFDTWYREAAATEASVPDAVSLATADATGAPSVRMVLLKGYDERGFVFYTNLGSKKAREIGENPRASLGFHWKTLKRQVRVSGHVLPVSAEEADAYFASRSRGSQIGAWASRQSQDLPSRKALELAVANAHDRFSTGVVPRPSFWSGFRVAPLTIEFWEELPFRLHRRDEYSRTEQGWSKRSLFP